MGPHMDDFQQKHKMPFQYRFLHLFWMLAALPAFMQAQTSIVLTASPNPVRFGAPVTLTATVTPATTTGRITFYDGVTVLGTAPIVGGKATIAPISLPADNTLLAGGSRKLRAVLVGNTGSAPSAISNQVNESVVAQPAGRFASGFSTPLVPSTVLVTADFNGDGKADFAVGETNEGARVFLGAGDGTFQLSYVFTGVFHITPSALAVGDFNGDGKTDLIVEDSNNGFVNLLLGNGDGTFQASGGTYSIPTSTAGTASIAVGDFNGDGKLDVIVANQSLVIFIGNGDGTLQPMVSLASGPTPQFVVVGDFNGDGKADLVTASSTAKVVSLMLGNGNATFQPAVNFNIPGRASWLAVGDFNQDGYADLVTANPDTSQSVSNAVFNNVSVLLSTGTGGSFQAPLTYASGFNPQSVVVADFNGDGVSDLIVGNGAPTPSFSVLLGFVGGTFAPAMIFPGTLQPFAMVASDFNGDGKTDIGFVSETVDGTQAFALNVLLGTNLNLTSTGGTPQSTVVGSAFLTPLQITLLDGSTPVSGATVTFTVPGSGASAVLSSSSAVTNSAGVASVAATANGAGGAYTVTATAMGLTSTFSLSNLVAAPSVLTPSPSTPQTAQVGAAFSKPLKVTLTDSAGNPASGVTVTFTAPSSGASATLSSSSVVTNAQGSASVNATANATAGSYNVTASAAGLTATFAMTNVNPAGLSLATSANSITFGAPVTFTATLSPSTATGRVTFYDGVNVLGTKPIVSGSASLSTILLPTGSRRITAYYSGDGNFGAVLSNALTETVRSNAGVGLQAGIPVGVAPAAPTNVVVGDFNGDGKADIALPGGQLGPALVIVALGNGDGTFQPLLSYPTGSGPTAVAVGDFNGDGKTDLAVTNFTGSVSILLGNGDGSFSSPANFPAGNTPTSLKVADFNGDGKPDLVVGGAGVSILLGNGDGTFGSPITLSGIANPSSIVVGDFNGDAKADLGIWAPGGSVLQILLGNGDGTFQSPISGFTLSNVQNTLSAQLTTADFNLDGIADISVSTPLGSVLLLGNGNGTFAPVQSLVTLGNVVGDFNGDSIPDLAGISNGVLFTENGNADGTFQNPATFAASSQPLGLAVADFNGDGRADIVAANSNLGNVSAGTFTVYLGVPGGVILTPSGTPQTTLAGSPFAQPLQVTVVNNGSPVANAVVTFAAPPVGASATLSSFTATTNASGVASVTATANLIPGAYVVTANYQGVSASFNLTNTGVTNLSATGGTPQTTLIGTAFATPLQVTLKDNTGAPVSGTTVNFTAPLSGASAVLSNSTAVTNAAGVASVTATANGTPGNYTVTASVGSLTASFSLTNTSSAPASITATGGTPQVALLGAPFPNPLQATVKDSNGNPVTGATVTFTPPANGAGAILSSATAVTDAFGVASVTATANNLAGSYAVTATVGSLSTTFSLTNLLGGGSNLAIGRTATQSSTLGGTSGPAVAVDGNTDGNFFDGSVTATNPDPNAWWQVDLGASDTINSVTIFNRTDCCGSRLGDFWVFISNNPFLATDTPATLQNRTGIFASHQTSAPNPSVTINTNGISGRYVRVQLSGTDYLSLAEVQVSGSTNTPPSTNLAMGKTASESSTLFGVSSAVASSAVDGNTNGSLFSGSVSSTNADTNAWWQVDLGVSSLVNQVVVWNRTDCCSSRLSDYWVFISNTPFLPTDTPTTLQNRAGTFASHQTTAPNPSASINANVQGRYVRVQLSGTDYLSLAEVQVMGTAPPATNISQGKFATQSSTLQGNGGAGLAVDGNQDGNYFDGSVTATNTDTNAWWQVDLGASASISSISIFNRTDCCISRLSDYWIFISDSPFQASDTPATLQNRAGTFASHQTSAPNPSITIPLTAQGRYVRIQLSGTDVLSLAEVQVFGIGNIANPTNVAFGKVASQSSTLFGFPTAGASAAVDGNTDGNLFDGSVTSTNLEQNPWWQVDLGVSPSISSIAIFNRTDCCSTRLNDYWIFISDTPFQPNDTPATLSGRPGTTSSHQTLTPSPSATIPFSAKGRYVRIQLSNPNYLSLAEVQVFGQ